MSDLAALPVRVYLFVCVVVGVVALWLARDAWLERDEPGGIEVAFYLAAAAGVSLLYAVRIAASSADVMAIALQLATPLVAALPILWVSFAFAYGGYDRWRTERWIVALAAPAVIWVLLAWSSRTHGLARRSFEAVQDGPFTLLELGIGPAGVAFLLYAYALYLVGVLVALDVYHRIGNRYRLQTFLLLLGATFPLVAGVATVFDVGSFGFLDWTPVAFVLHGVFLYGTVFWLGTLDATIAARDTAVEVMQDPVIVAGSDGRIRDLNPAAERLLPHDAADLTLSTLLPLLDSDRGQPIEIDGRYFDVQEDPIRDPRGADRGHVFLLRDVTARERRQEELERREEQLERQNERLEDFAGVVSHDLRNPLAAATAAVELARHVPDEREMALERAAEAHAQMDDLIDGLLSLATAGEAVDSLDAVSVDATVRTVWSRLETAEATLSIDGDATIQADPDRLAQLLANLFRNAVEHGGEDVSVQVRIERGDTTARIAIEDDGPGIPDDERTRVFDRGVSLGGGTGLGLAIVGDIVEAHGWSIVAEEGEAGGARFCIDAIALADTDGDADAGADTGADAEGPRGEPTVGEEPDVEGTDAEAATGSVSGTEGNGDAVSKTEGTGGHAGMDRT
ncbi:sensor histidine kinase [Halorubrum vacuolatum]|uniref:histidine kinase n=1 Tax=Halorubrum vacuolatum TaxID=63740 RepID=A0A238UVR8_HALVU|nr:histidine kinase N-terminal 7TM domain-containing protein [Halorubrum vacuolatum]SNR25319.1 Signal transduction histidine kinase [Halorubrum vacuolatum]